MARTIAVIALAIALLSGPAQAKKVALLIGNAEYAHTSELKNPINDINAINAMAIRL